MFFFFLWSKYRFIRNTQTNNPNQQLSLTWKQKPPKRLIDDKAEMDRLREESRRLEQAQKEVEAERAQLRAELKAKKAKKKAEEAAKQAEEAKKAAKEKEKGEKKELRRQAELDLRKEDEARVADLRKGQTGGSTAAFYPADPGIRG